jgi:hypothetical protein
MRDGLPDETRVDATFGGHFGDDWMVLAQAYGGQADDGGPRWLSVETSVVRHLGDWSVQAGWRRRRRGGKRRAQAVRSSVCGAGSEIAKSDATIATDGNRTSVTQTLVASTATG